MRLGFSTSPPVRGADPDDTQEGRAVISVRDQNICRARELRSIDADQDLTWEISALTMDEEQVVTRW
jgi:hypothetical protein